MSEGKKVLLEKVREFEARTGHTVDSFPEDPNNTASVLKEPRYLSELLAPEEAKRQMFARSRRGFLVGGVAALAAVFGWRWMSAEIKDALLKRTFEFNEKVSQIFFSPNRLAAEFPPERITASRVNGFEGLEGEFDPKNWTLAVGGLAGRPDDLIFTPDDIKKPPPNRMINRVQCIQGVGYIVKWASVR